MLATATAPTARAVHRGSDAPFGSYRFMVSLRLAATPDAPRCGGTLIAPDIVLTAGHCAGGVPQGALVAVVGADVADWPSAPRVATPGHRVRDGFGPSGGPLLVRDRTGAFRQVGVTSLGADSKVKLYAGFTSIPLERRWIATAIASLRR